MSLLKDLCVKIGSGATPRGGANSYLGGNYSLIRSQNVLDFVFAKQGLAKINYEQAKRLSNVEVLENDVLLNITGDSVARCCQVDNSILPARVNQHVCIIRTEESKLNPRFLKYWLLNSTTKNFLLTLASSGATRNALTKGLIENLEISTPSLQQQDAIAYVLGTLDDKIEQNKKMKQSHEEIAKAIFRSWFVDFDPVRAKTEGRSTGLPPEISDLFPDELVESENGEVPKGWEVTGLSSQLSFVLGGDWGKAKLSDQTPNKCLCIRGADIAHLQGYVASDMPVRYLKDSSLAKRSLKPWDVVFEISGGSPTQSTGRSVLVTPEILDNYNLPLTTSNFCRLLRFNTQEASLYHYFSFRSAYDQDEYFHYETGTTGIKNFGFKYYSEEIKYVLPSESCLKAFSKIVTPIIEKSGLTLQEDRVLSSIRDVLLPKLISGELRIPNAEKFLEKAGI